MVLESPPAAIPIEGQPNKTVISQIHDFQHGWPFIKESDLEHSQITDAGGNVSKVGGKSCANVPEG